MFVERRLREDERFMRGEHYTAMQNEERVSQIQYEDWFDLWAVECREHDGDPEEGETNGVRFFTGDLSIAVRRANLWLGGENRSNIYRSTLHQRVTAPEIVPDDILLPILPVRLRDDWWRLSGGVIHFGRHNHGKHAFLYPRVPLTPTLFIHPVQYSWTRSGRSVMSDAASGAMRSSEPISLEGFATYDTVLKARTGMQKFFDTPSGDPDFNSVDPMCLFVGGDAYKRGARPAYDVGAGTRNIGFGYHDVERAKTDPYIIHGYTDISDLQPRTHSRLTEEGLISVERDEDMADTGTPPRDTKKRKRTWG